MIPIPKIVGQRFGQLIYNSIAREKPASIRDEAEVVDRLFYIENYELSEAVKRYILSLPTD